MDFRATKDTYEREYEEAERLVRPAPKLKPPRHDKRREDIRPESDPDVDGDPDTKKDPDLSLNYKNVGGSAGRILARFLYADEPSNRKRVRKKDTGKIVYVSDKTLQERGGEYEKADQEAPAKKEEPESGPKKLDEHQEIQDEQKADPEDSGRQLWEKAEDDPKLKEVFKKILDPKSELSYMLANNPKVDVKHFMLGQTPPVGVKTLGDLYKALSKGQGSKGKKPKTAPVKPPEAKPATPPVGEKAPQAPAAAPAKEEEAPSAKGEAPPAQEGKRETPPPPPEKPAKAETPPAKPAPPETPAQVAKREKAEAEAKQVEQAKSIVEKFKKKLLADPSEVDRLDKYFKDLPSAVDTPDGVGFYDEKKKDFTPFDDLSPLQQKKIVEEYNKDRGVQDFADSVKDNPKVKDALSQLLDRQSDLSRQIGDLGNPDQLPIAKNIPALADVKLPEGVKTIGELTRLISTKPDLFVKKEPIDEWESEGGLQSPEFKQWAKLQEFPVGPDGSVLLPKGKSKGKGVPWKSLSPDDKASLYDRFQGYVQYRGKIEAVRALTENPEIAKLVKSLSDSKSKRLQKLLGVKQLKNRQWYGGRDDDEHYSDEDDDDDDYDDYSYGRYSEDEDESGTDLYRKIPELKGIQLPPGTTAMDVVRAAKEIYPPIPEPKRREVSKDEVAAASSALDRNLTHQGVLAERVHDLNLHPDDVKDVVTQFQQAKAVKIKPDDIENAIKNASGSYVEDPAEIPHPKKGLNSEGKETDWDKLTTPEQSDAYAKHRNQVLAASFGLREQVAEALTANTKLPLLLGSFLAGTMLSKKTGSPDEQWAKTNQMASTLYDNVITSGKKPAPLDDETVKATLERTKHDPSAQKIAVAYAQAQDYLDARSKFLDEDSPQRIDERDPPAKLAANILNATKFLQQQSKRYPKEYRGTLDPAAKLRRRIMDRLRTLHPDKAAEIEPQMQEADADEWDDLEKIHKELTAKREKAVKQYQKAWDQASKDLNKELKAKGGDTSASVHSIDQRLREKGVTMPPKPDPLPEKPIGYDRVRKGPSGLRAKGKAFWDKLVGKKKTANSRVVARYLSFSTCTKEETMGKPLSSPKNASGRTAVYWGVEPYPADKGPSLYPRWQQSQARDLNDFDYDNILTAAKQWLKSSVLSSSIEGIEPDTQFRAALDLAIRDHAGGRYSVGLYPTVYNQLLARLAGKPENETLLTIRKASGGSVYEKTPGEERPTMSASVHLRKYAASIADSHPGIAFDLSNLAFKLAEDEQQSQDQGQQQGQQVQAKKAGEMPEALKKHMEEKKDGQGQGQQQDQGQDQGQDEGQKQASYRSLKAAVLSAAKSNPNARAAFMPVLQTIKKLG